jgi:hypothetical protein
MVGAKPLTIQSLTGFDPAATTGIPADFLEALAGQGKTLADMSVAFATTDDASSLIEAIRVAGAGAAALVHAAVALFAEGEEIEQAEDPIADGSVAVFIRPSDEQRPYYAFPRGDIVWIVVAQEPALSEILLALGVPVTDPLPNPSPSTSDDLCLLSLEELNDITGLRFATMAAGTANCSYDSDPADDLYTIDLRVEDQDPTAQDMGDGLILVRMQYPDGTDTVVARFPAWESPNGLWVNIGEDLFVVQPILFFATDPPSARTFLVPIAELALTRLGRAGASRSGAPA